MNRMNLIKCLLSMAGASLMTVYAGNAAAHTQGGGLAAADASTDYYQVTCADDGSGPPARLEVQVLGGAGPRALAVVSKGVVYTTTVDATAGDAAASPLVPVAQAAGVYNVAVGKAGNGAISYTLTYHCKTAGNVHTGTSIVSKQNQ